LHFRSNIADPPEATGVYIRGQLEKRSNDVEDIGLQPK
jgi:hypothetical protein